MASMLRTMTMGLMAVILAGSARADMGLPELPGTYNAGAAYGSAQSQTSLADMQKQVKELLDAAQAAQDSSNRLTKLLDRLLNATGVTLGGEAVMHSVNFLRLTPVDDAQRVWPTVGYFDFAIKARPKPELSAEVVYRMEKVFGGFWGALDIAGVRWFNIKGETPIGFEVGMFHYKHSPLTVWAPEDPHDFEPEILARKRAAGKETVLIEDDAFALQGVKLDAGLRLFGAVDLDLESIAVRTVIAGNKNSSLAFAVTFPFDQYLVGGTAEFHGADSKAITVGASYFELIESTDTNQSVALFPPQRGNVIAGDVGLQLLGEEITLNAEGALSNYNPAYGQPQVVSWTSGGAGNLFLNIQNKDKTQSVKLHALYVDEQFINYAAQTRQEDTLREPNGDYATGNNLYNPRDGSYTLAVGDISVDNRFFNRYNGVIFASNQGPAGGLMLNKYGMQPAGIYLTGSILNRSLPLGYATPNRSGFGGEYKGSFMGGLIQPKLTGGMYNEPFVAFDVPENAGPRAYLRGGAGVKTDLSTALGIPLTLQAGAVVEDTRSNSFVAFTSTRIGYDADWEAFKGIHLLAGFQHSDFNGADFFNFGAGSTWAYMDMLVDEYVGGIDWRISKSTQFFITYTFLDAVDGTNGMTNFQNQEFESKLRMRF